MRFLKKIVNNFGDLNIFRIFATVIMIRQRTT